MDQTSLSYAMGVLEEIDGALRPISMYLEKLDTAQTEGIPTGVIRPEGENPAWEIACNVVPTHRDNVSTTYVQLYLQLTDPCPERREALERYAWRRNGQMLLGTLVVFRDCLCFKYTMALEPAAALEASHFQAAVFAFCQQAEQFARQGRAICQGVQTVEEALAGENP